MKSVECNQRQTKYCKSIVDAITTLHHATNNQILSHLKTTYPDLSATTVHRAAARLASRKIINIAPSDNDGSIRYDSNVDPHDHFICTDCGKVVDIDVKESITPLLHNVIEGCCISGRLTINGTCSKCNIKEKI